MKVPKLRFKDDKGQEFPGWKTQKAGLIFCSVSDKGHIGLPVLSATQDRGMVNRDENGISIIHDKTNEISYKRVVPGQFVIHLRSFQGGFAHSNIKGITSPAYTVLDFYNKDEHHDYFWKHFFSSDRFIKSLEKVTYGIRDGRSISYTDFSSLPLSYPVFTEQVKIGNFFTAIDEKLTLAQKQLETLQQLKKGFMQKMFV